MQSQKEVSKRHRKCEMELRSDGPSSQEPGQRGYIPAVHPAWCRSVNTAQRWTQPVTANQHRTLLLTNRRYKSTSKDLVYNVENSLAWNQIQSTILFSEQRQH